VSADSHHVLVVEDSPPCRRILEIEFARARYRVTSIEDAKQAIEALRQARFQAAVVDLVLPVGSGIDVIKIIRRVQPWIFAIAVTGVVSENVRLYALGEGFDRFVFKPYRARDVISMLPR